MGWLPAARTRWEPASSCPSFKRTARAVGSAETTSAILKSTLGCFRNSLRIAIATSDAASCEVATWYRSGRNWW